MTTLIVPGLHSSDTGHWQTWLEGNLADAARVEQNDWNDASLPEWASRIRRGIAGATQPVFIVAHSFGALAAVQAANDHAERIGGVLLVAPADPKRFGVADFLPTKQLAFPSIVVASTTDPWISIEAASGWARLWGSELVNLRDAGHINTQSGFGPWPGSLELLAKLRRANAARLSSARLDAVSERHHWARDRLKPARGKRIAAFRRETADIGQAAAMLRSAGWTVEEPQARSVAR
jgi:uncharacterized protein